MKKIVTAAVVLALLGAVPGQALAGRGWGVRGGHGRAVVARHGGFGVGAFFAGLIGGAILSSVIHDSRPQVVYAPPVEPDRVWVDGRYETRVERRWVPGHWEGVREGGRDPRSLWNEDGEDRVEAGDRDEYEGGRVWVPGRYRDVEVRVWVEGHWEERG